MVVIAPMLTAPDHRDDYLAGNGEGGPAAFKVADEPQLSVSSSDFLSSPFFLSSSDFLSSPFFLS
jgi:hypothetical protein